VKQLALEYPASARNSGPLLVYLTARDKTRGEAARASLLDDAQLQKAKVLAANGGLSDIIFHPLDISQSDSIHAFSNFLKKEHPDGIDFVVNNAGTALNGFGMLPMLFLQGDRIAKGSMQTSTSLRRPWVATITAPWKPLNRSSHF